MCNKLTISVANAFDWESKLFWFNPGVLKLFLLFCPVFNAIVYICVATKDLSSFLYVCPFCLPLTPSFYSYTLCKWRSLPCNIFFEILYRVNDPLAYEMKGSCWTSPATISLPSSLSSSGSWWNGLTRPSMRLLESMKYLLNTLTRPYLPCLYL